MLCSTSMILFQLKVVNIRLIIRELNFSRLHHIDVNDDDAVDHAKNMSWTTIHRVCGDIAVSRSIGDPDFKPFSSGTSELPPFNWPSNHDKV